MGELGWPKCAGMLGWFKWLRMLGWLELACPTTGACLFKVKPGVFLMVLLPLGWVCISYLPQIFFHSLAETLGV